MYISNWYVYVDTYYLRINSSFLLWGVDAYGIVDPVPVTFWVETCGFEYFSAARTITYLVGQKLDGSKHTIPAADLVGALTLTNTGSSCFMETWVLYNDSALTVPWNDPRLVNATDLPQLNFTYPLNISLAQFEKYEVYMKATTYGLINTSFPIGIEVCEIIKLNQTHPQVTETFSMIPFRFNITADGLDYINLTEYFQGKTTDCLYTNWSLELYNETDDTFSPYTHDLVTLDAANERLIVNTTVAINETFFTVKVYDLFGNFALKNLSLFVCGNEPFN